MSSPERAPPARSDSLDARAEALARDIVASLARGDLGGLAPESLQALMAATCRAYSANAETDPGLPVLSQQSGVTGTDVMLVCSALLKAADLQIFELGMWSSWTGR